MGQCKILSQRMEVSLVDLLPLTTDSFLDVILKVTSLCLKLKLFKIILLC